MAIPERVSEINVTSAAVMYNCTDFTVSWSAVDGATSYRLELSGDGGGFATIYEGTDLSFAYDISKTRYSKLIFRVYAVNSDGDSPFTDSGEVTVIDWLIEDIGGTLILQPAGLIIDSESSKIGDVPSGRETSETITGLHGEIPVDIKYSPRLFDLVAFMSGTFPSLAEREEYIRNMSAHIDRSVRSLRYLMYHGYIFGVKRISSEFHRKPSHCNLDISFKAYDVFGHSPIQNVLYGDGICVNGGSEEAYPLLILRGEQNNPVITVNSIEYQIAVDMLDGDILYIDCEKESVIRERDGVRTYAAGAFYMDYPVFAVGKNTVSGCYAVKWRDRYFAI